MNSAFQITFAKLFSNFKTTASDLDLCIKLGLSSLETCLCNYEFGAVLITRAGFEDVFYLGY